MKIMKKAIVIGGGIHGLTAALALAKKDIKVTLIEKNSEIINGTSNATHNRAHAGYHYPRSIETAKECLQGLTFFKKEFPEALKYPKESYYLLEKNDSKTSAKEFEKFCRKMKIPYEIVRVNDKLWKREQIECGFRVPEPIFDVEALKRLFKKKLRESGVKILTNTEVIGFRKQKDKYLLRTVNISGIENEHETDIILNATYAYANNLMKIFGVKQDMTEYELQKTEIVVVRSKSELPALTVMDGNFISLMPLAGTKEKYLIYDVTHSVINRKKGYYLNDKIHHPTNFEKMMEHGRKYFPFMDQLKFVKSNHGFRPIPLNIANDSRKTRILRHDRHPNIYSICEGKFISAPLIAEELIALMRKNKTL